MPPTGRLVLDGVPKVCFYDGTRCPEDVPFPSCLRACLEYFGENRGCNHVPDRDPQWPCGCAYAYLLGTTGAGFRFLWKSGWHGDNVDILVMAEDTMEPFRRGFASVGYAFEALSKEGGPDDEEWFRASIRASLSAGKPVIGFGVIGPPECCLVTGYDEGGDVLIGWSFFQGMCDFNPEGEFEPDGTFRKRRWFQNTPGLLVIGEKTPRPPCGEVYREALRWGLTVMRTADVKGRAAGHAAYDAWAEHMLRDEDFATDDYAVLNDRYMAYFDATGTIAEGRWYVNLFLQQIAGCEPAMAEDLNQAAACFRAEHDMMWEIWNLAGGNGWTEAHVRKLAEPETRRAMIPVILRARDKDIEAAAHTERALGR